MIKNILNNRYQIIRKLGQGGFGTTYLAKDIQAANYLCAVKQLNPDHADIETAKILFDREAHTLFRLQAIPQVPQFIDYFRENDNYYIVEEYIQGTPLNDLLGEKWSSQNIIILLWEILSILQLLHQKNIIHRDIKPSNLIQREKDSKLTIIDFGAVKELKNTQERIQETCVFNFGYAPPEQVTGIPRLNSDIYALGMTAIQLLTKTHPQDIIKDENDNVVWTKNLSVSTSLTDILNKMVKKDWQNRYQSVEEVLKDIRAKGSTILKDTSKNINPTIIKPEVTQTPVNNPAHKHNAQRNIYQLLYVPLLLAIILLFGSEIINPWMRPWYYLHRGNSLLDKNQAKASLSQFQKAINLNREFSSAWKGRGDALFILRRYPGALEAYNKAIALEPNNLKAINNKGKVLTKQGAFAKAIDTHDRAIKIDANNAEAWSSKGIAYMSLQQYEQALESFEQAQKIKPDEPSIWLQKGIVLKSLQRTQEAKEFYQESLAVYDEKLAKNKNNPSLWTDRGFVWLQLNQPQEAFAAYDRALLLDKNFYEAWMGKANALINYQQYQQAIAALDKAAEIRPQDYQVWYNKGNILSQALNKPEQAIASFERATELKPDFYPAWLAKGIALTVLQKYNEALKAFDTAKDLNPQDPFVWVNRGLVLEELQEYDLASEAYKKAAIELKFEPANEYLDNLQQKLES